MLLLPGLVQSLVRKLRSHKPHGTPQKKVIRKSFMEQILKEKQYFSRKMRKGILVEGPTLREGLGNVESADFAVQYQVSPGEGLEIRPQRQTEGYDLQAGIGTTEVTAKKKSNWFCVLNRSLPNRVEMKFSCLVTQSCPTLCDPMDCSMPGFPVLHPLPELAQTHIHWVSDAIQPSHPLSSPSPGFNLSHYQDLFQWDLEVIDLVMDRF